MGNMATLVKVTNGLALNEQQFITWTNDDQITWLYITSLDHNELTHWLQGDSTIILNK